MPHFDDIGFVEGSATSRAAAESLDAQAAGARVLAAIRDAGTIGLTCDELEERINMRHQTASSRIRALVLAGHVVDSGRTRKTRSGRQATVWIELAIGAQGNLF